MNELNVIGLNHKTAPVALRERFAFNPAQQVAALQQFHIQGCPHELMLLSTCNRTEIIFAGAESQIAAVEEFIQNIAGDQFSEQELNSFLYRYHDEQALHHLFRLASGLDSLVVGEAQILGQLKAAFELSNENDLIASSFTNLYQQILRCARTVRRDTEIGRGLVSVASVAVQMAQNIFSSLLDKKVLLLGAGEMCELAGVHFREAGVAEINVANRSVANADKLANKFCGRSYSLDQLSEAILASDIILSSTGSPEPVITRQLIKNLLPKRSRPLFFIDIAVPRDIEPEVNQLHDVFLYNIDDLNSIIEQNRQSRMSAVHEAEAIVAKMMKAYYAERATEEIAPLISSLRARFHSLKDEELSKLTRKNDFSPGQQEQIERSFNLLINKILHDPTITLRQGAAKGKSSRISSIFKELFNL